jgi:hypothetical protein
MTYAQLKPVRSDLLLAIPPPTGYVFPKGSEELKQRLSKLSQAQLDTARQSFIQKAETGYYSEVSGSNQVELLFAYSASGSGFHIKIKLS